MKILLAVCLVALLLEPAATFAQSQGGSQSGSAQTQTGSQAGSAQPPPAESTTGTTVPGAAATTGTVPAIAPSDYRLGSGDKIRVEVYKEPQLSQSLQVRPDGKITMPWIGDLTAVGLTPEQLRDQIGSQLKEYVHNPMVTVMVVEALASTVYIGGEVNKPGAIPLIGPMTPVQAIAMAGGFKDFANTRDILINRQGPDGWQTLHFNYKDAIKGKGQPLYLQRGDTITVQ
jgi:polysaccharide export outer membrane protein